MEETKMPEEGMPAEKKIVKESVNTRVLAEPAHPKVAGMQPEDWESVPSPRLRRR